MSELSPEQWSEVTRIFGVASDLSSPERAEYLGKECIDPEVAREVLSLLEYSGEQRVPVHAAIADAAAAVVQEPDFDGRWIGARFGPYRLDSLAGHGGMGAVYRASRDDAEFQQQVAIKLVRVAAESPATLRRFRQERQILARLSHPNIARLLDGGSTPEGVPYLVMELIDGEPIGAWCDRKGFDIRERLRIFLKVCDGVEFAHGVGVVHRDLKPGNILVAQDGTPKLLDFGIAKLLDDPERKDSATMTSLRVMTPDYASPEQVRGERVSTPADIYSLGLILYELLTATKAQSITGHAHEEIVSAVCRAEPVSPALLNRKLAGDLDHIIRMAIRKEPERRYASVSLFAADIRRHLDGLPVLAAPDSFGYRSAKFLRRNRGVVTAGILISATVAGGLALEYWLGAFARGPHVSQVLQLTQTGRVKVGSGVVTDGSQVFFTELSGAQKSLAQVSVKGGTPVPLPVTPALRSPDILDISSDHSQLLVADVIAMDDYSLWSVPLHGGSARRVGDVVAQKAGAWSPDGKRIVFAHGAGLFLVNTDGTGLHKLIDTPGAFAGDIRWAPARESHVLRFSLMPDATWVGALWEVNSDGSRLHRLLEGWKTGAAHPDGDYNGNWIPSGKYFLFRSRLGQFSSIWAIREHAFRLPSSQMHPLQVYSGPLDFNPITINPDGKRIFFPAGQERRELVRYNFQRGEFLPYLSGVAGRWVDYSRDQRQIAYTLAPANTLWRSLADGSERVQITTGDLLTRQPRWSPDGKWIAFGGTEPGKPYSKVYVAAVVQSGSATPECITPGQFTETEPSWSPDGKLLLFHRESNNDVSGQSGLYVMNWATREAKLLPGSGEILRSSWSPNPRYITATNRAASQIMLFDFQTQRWIQLAAGRSLGPPQWSRDGKYVYFQDVIGAKQPIFRVQIGNRRVERVMDSGSIPQSNVTGYSLAGMAPGDEPIATVVRSNSDLYALDVDLP